MEWVRTGFTAVSVHLAALEVMYGRLAIRAAYSCFYFYFLFFYLLFLFLWTRLAGVPLAIQRPLSCLSVGLLVVRARGSVSCFSPSSPPSNPFFFSTLLIPPNHTPAGSPRALLPRVHRRA